MAYKIGSRVDEKTPRIDPDVDWGEHDDCLLSLKRY